MRKQLLLLPLALACAKTETAQTDTAAMAMAPAALTANDVAGTWNGTVTREGSDSILARWTVVATTPPESKMVFEGSSDTLALTSTFDADSMMTTSPPYDDPSTPAKEMVVFRSVGRLQSGKLVGTSMVMLADKPDSVVARSRWEATRAP
jgi:hypothetical protein